MTTKEEYIEALERMKVSYYNLDVCMSAMNKFKEDINLLTELVNEHFEIKQETNYEHYKDKIIEDGIFNLALVNGKPKRCHNVHCNDCDFKSSRECKKKLEKWLKQPYKKQTYKLTKFEIDLLQSCSQGYSPKCQFKNINSLTEMRKNWYFKCINRDETLEDILAKCEVVG